MMEQFFAQNKVLQYGYPTIQFQSFQLAISRLILVMSGLFDCAAFAIENKNDGFVIKARNQLLYHKTKSTQKGIKVHPHLVTFVLSFL